MSEHKSSFKVRPSEQNATEKQVLSLAERIYTGFVGRTNIKHLSKVEAELRHILAASVISALAFHGVRLGVAEMTHLIVSREMHTPQQMIAWALAGAEVPAYDPSEQPTPEPFDGPRLYVLGPDGPQITVRMRTPVTNDPALRAELEAEGREYVRSVVQRIIEKQGAPDPDEPVFTVELLMPVTNDPVLNAELEAEGRAYLNRMARLQVETELGIREPGAQVD